MREKVRLSEPPVAVSFVVHPDEPKLFSRKEDPSFLYPQLHRARPAPYMEWGMVERDSYV